MRKLALTTALTALTSSSAVAEPILELAPRAVGQAEGAAFDGCPAGSYDYQMASDSSALRLRLFSMDVAAGYGRPQLDTRTCQLDFTARVADGWSFSIEEVDATARTWLSDSAAEAAVQAAYSLEYARQPVQLLSRSFRGPYDGDLLATGRVDRGGAQWSSCDGNTDKALRLAVRSSARAGHGSSAELRGAGRGFDQAVVVDYRLSWRRCPTTPPPTPPPARGWRAECRVVHETIWGTDLRDFWAVAVGNTRGDAVNTARSRALYACEVERRSDGMTRCVVDPVRCDATPER